MQGSVVKQGGERTRTTTALALVSQVSDGCCYRFDMIKYFCAPLGEARKGELAQMAQPLPFQWIQLISVLFPSECLHPTKVGRIIGRPSFQLFMHLPAPGK